MVDLLCKMLEYIILILNFNFPRSRKAKKKKRKKIIMGFFTWRSTGDLK